MFKVFVKIFGEYNMYTFNKNSNLKIKAFRFFNFNDIYDHGIFKKVFFPEALNDIKFLEFISFVYIIL